MQYLRPRKSDLQLLDIHGDEDIQFLYEMLKNRPAYANISHRDMPSYEEHKLFVESKPYEIWYIIRHKGVRAGNIYLTNANEIGVFIVPEKRAQGLGSHAVRLLMGSVGKRKYFANIAPDNSGSEAFFKKLGFRKIQHTYELA